MLGCAGDARHAHAWDDLRAGLSADLGAPGEAKQVRSVWTSNEGFGAVESADGWSVLPNWSMPLSAIATVLSK